MPSFFEFKTRKQKKSIVRLHAKKLSPKKDGELQKKQPAQVTQSLLNKFHKAFVDNPKNILAMNAVTTTSIHTVAKNRQVVNATNHIFSHVLKAGESTSQNSSGRCWLFAGLNPLRASLMKKLKLDDKFELSQNYLMFYDKLEKSNFFLENVLRTLDEPIGSRLLDWLLMSPIQDGGQWDMFLNLVRKYGVLPKTFMPETESSSNTGLMNALVTAKLREFAHTLRRYAEKGAKMNALREEKLRMMETIYRMLAIHLGVPPQKFYWQWRDKENKFHREGWMTPLEFYEKYTASELESKICLIHCPQKSKKFNTLYTIDFLGNVVGGDIIRYLNVELPILKLAAIEQILSGEAVWFGCDVGKMLDRDLGILDMKLYDYESVYGTKPKLNKAERLDYGQSAMNHAMVFVGVDLDEKKRPRKWRVENSWGDKGGDKGFLVMSDEWFDEYVYEVAVNKKFLPKKLLPILETEPVRLPPWDPMGALAIAP